MTPFWKPSPPFSHSLLLEEIARSTAHDGSLGHDYHTIAQLLCFVRVVSRHQDRTVRDQRIIDLTQSDYRNPPFFQTIMLATASITGLTTVFPVSNHECAPPYLTQLPYLSFLYFSSIFSISLLAAGSIPAVGSSRRITSLRAMRAIPTHSLRFIPPERWADRCKATHSFQIYSFIVPSKQAVRWFTLIMKQC